MDTSNIFDTVVLYFSEKKLTVTVLKLSIKTKHLATC